MKKFNLYLFLILLSSTAIIQSCSDDDNSTDLAWSGKYPIEMATVERETESSNPYFVWDNNESVLVTSSSVPYKSLETGQRILGSFTILATDTSKYDHEAHLNDYVKVLTKEVVELTEANNDSIGNSKSYITSIWMDNDYLNVEFWMVYPSYERHRVNLVKNTITPPDESDGYLHLEFRYNDMGDSQGTLWSSLVSFKLNTFGPSESSYIPKGVKVKINSAPNGEKEITLDYPPKNIRNRIYLENVNSEKIH